MTIVTLRRKKRNFGLTVFESLVAMALLAGVVLTITFTATRTVQAAYRGHHQQVATGLLLRELARYTNTPEEVEATPSVTTFETGSALYEITATSSIDDGPEIYRLRVAVSWTENGQVKSIQKSDWAIRADD